MEHEGRTFPACSSCMTPVRAPAEYRTRDGLLPTTEQRVAELAVADEELDVHDICEAVGLGQPEARTRTYQRVWSLMKAARRSTRGES